MKNVDFTNIKKAKPANIAIIPGSFKPPGRHHFDLIKHYSKVADEVIVIISNPSAKSVRVSNLNKAITPNISKKIFEIYLKESAIQNVTIKIADSPSPIKACYDFIDTLEEVKLVAGASQKDNDISRWKNLTKYIEKNSIPIILLETEKYLAPISTNIDGAISASQVRSNINDFNTLRKYVPTEVSNENVYKIMNLLS